MDAFLFTQSLPNVCQPPRTPRLPTSRCSPKCHVVHSPLSFPTFPQLPSPAPQQLQPPAALPSTTQPAGAPANTAQPAVHGVSQPAPVVVSRCSRAAGSGLMVTGMRPHVVEALLASPRPATAIGVPATAAATATGAAAAASANAPPAAPVVPAAVQGTVPAAVLPAVAVAAGAGAAAVPAAPAAVVQAAAGTAQQAVGPVVAAVPESGSTHVQYTNLVGVAPTIQFNQVGWYLGGRFASYGKCKRCGFGIGC